MSSEDTTISRYPTLAPVIRVSLQLASLRAKRKINVMTSEGNTDPNNVTRATDPPDNRQSRSEISEDAQLPTRTLHGCSGEKKKHWLDYAIFGAAVVAELAAVAAAWFTGWQVQIAKDTSYAQLRP